MIVRYSCFVEIDLREHVITSQDKLFGGVKPALRDTDPQIDTRLTVRLHFDDLDRVEQPSPIVLSVIHADMEGVRSK